MQVYRRSQCRRGRGRGRRRRRRRPHTSPVLPTNFTINLVHFIKVCKFRTERQLVDPAYTPRGLAALFIAFVTYGFGGALLADILCGMPIVVSVGERDI